MVWSLIVPTTGVKERAGLQLCPSTRAAGMVDAKALGDHDEPSRELGSSVCLVSSEAAERAATSMSPGL